RRLEEKLVFERAYNFFRCARCKAKGDKVPFEIAVECGFRCPACGGALVYWDNRREIQELEEQLRRARGP
ncbi:MAG: transcription initiation factor E subunit alpha, partial [Candidatus Micrarchaeota archaeon]